MVIVCDDAMVTGPVSTPLEGNTTPTCALAMHMWHTHQLELVVVCMSKEMTHDDVLEVFGCVEVETTIFSPVVYHSRRNMPNQQNLGRENTLPPRKCLPIRNWFGSRTTGLVPGERP